MNTAVIELAGVRFAYPGGDDVLRGVDLTVHRGERVAVLGPNGAGKTTLAFHFNGIYTASAGTVRICGMPLARSTISDIRRRVGVLFQDPDDQLFMPTVHDDVAFGPANFGADRAALPAIVARALDAVGMTGYEGVAPHHLSFGQRRRVAAATVVAMEPDVLVLDEPSSNLDPQARRGFAELIRELDLTTVMITHDLPYAWELCERSVIMSGGRIVADGPTSEVLRDEALMAAHRLELPRGFAVDR